MRKIYLTNQQQRDAMVRMNSVKGKARPRLGLVEEKVSYAKYTAASKEGLHEALQERFGEDYGQALIDGDPEVDREFVGRKISHCDRVYLSHKGEVLHHAPEEIEIILKPDGSERERRAPVDVPANMSPDIPIRWTGKRIPKRDVVRRFVLNRHLLLQHVDGLTYDYLYGMAKDLHESGDMMLMGGGPKGKEPLILVPNGSPYRGLLEGRIDGDRYLLMLHLSNMELKLPEESES